MRGSATVLLLMLASAVAAAAAPSHQQVNRTIASEIALPAHRDFAAAAADLEPALEAFCAGPSEDALDAARTAFNDAMDAWQKVQPVAFGPLTWQSRRATIHYWPDRHGTGARQLTRALARQDERVIETLIDQSVALQNLSTLEVLLYDEDLSQSDDTRAAYACDLALAIARLQGETAQAVLADWETGFYEAFVTAAEGNDRYFDAEEASTDQYRILTEVMDTIIVRKLEEPLDTSLDKAKPRRAENWRSERSLRNLELNLETIAALLTVDGGLLGPLEEANQEEAERVRSMLGAIAKALMEIDLPLAKAVVDPEERADVERLLQDLRELRTAIQVPVMTAAGIRISFNASDGD